MFQPANSITLAKDELAIGVTYGAFGSHTGISFISAKEGQQLLHLAWHKKIVVEPFPERDGEWIVCKIVLPPALRLQLVGIVRAVAKRMPQIGYAVDSIGGKGSFDSNGNYKPPKGSVGLTCASFISELLRAARAPLIIESSWPATQENIAWANGVIELLEKTKTDAAHIAAVRNSITGIRIRPEEIGAAATIEFKSRPVDFLFLEPHAKNVMKSLSDFFPKPKIE